MASKPYHDANVLRRLYHNEKKSIPEIAKSFGVSYRTIWNWMDKHNIERRERSERSKLSKLKQPAHYKFQNSKGYECWHTQLDGEKYYVSVHRLLAVSEYGYDAVCGKDVHHDNGVKFDNRPSNITLIDKGKHGSVHGGESSTRQPYWDKETLNELYHGENMNQKQIAEKYDVSVVTIRKWMKRLGVNTRWSST